VEEKKERILLRKILETEEAVPAPRQLQLGDTWYEFDVSIGELGHVKIFIENNLFFDIMEDEDCIKDEN
jgi:hypothetical protein